ncbi:MAG TPA: thioredoxin fold domain-containing protein [Candidatus Limnocylindrales bacterium]|nr:thioredoxin fold domain-containing protein [Candidatus Limnocylindrales bacterium]
MVVLFAAIAIAASAAAGSEPQAPGAKAAEAAAPASDAPQLRFEPFQDDAFIAARKSGAPVVLYFEADWCAPCREMHARTFPAPQVLSASSGIRFFRVDMTKPNRYLALVQESFQILGEPTVVIFGPDGKERSRRFGFVPPDDFAKMLSESRTPPPGT